MTNKICGILCLFLILLTLSCGGGGESELQQMPMNVPQGGVEEVESLNDIESINSEVLNCAPGTSLLTINGKSQCVESSRGNDSVADSSSNTSDEGGESSRVINAEGSTMDSEEDTTVVSTESDSAEADMDGEDQNIEEGAVDASPDSESEGVKACIDASCGAEVEACKLNGNCAITYLCIAECGNDVTCAYACIELDEGDIGTPLFDLQMCAVTEDCLDMASVGNSGGEGGEGSEEEPPECGDGVCEWWEEYFCPEDCAGESEETGATGEGGDDKSEAITCLADNCGPELAECISEPDCSQFLECLITCGTETGCLQNCGVSLDASLLGGTAGGVVTCGFSAGCIELGDVGSDEGGATGGGQGGGGFADTCGDGVCDEFEEFWCPQDCEGEEEQEEEEEGEGEEGGFDDFCGDGVCEWWEEFYCTEDCAGGEESEEEAEEGGGGQGGSADANSCAGIWHCELGCLSGECGCQEGFDGEDAGLLAYAGLANCLDSACPLNNGDCIADEVTFTGKCLAEAEACVPDAAGGKCSDVVSCILETCEPGDTACEEDCFKGAKLENHVYGELYAACVQENCEEYPYTEECIQKAKDLTCGTQWSACNNSDF